MSTKQTTPSTITGRLSNAVSQFSSAIKRLLAHDSAASANGASDLMQLYLLSRGSDSVRPAVIRKLRADARA